MCWQTENIGSVMFLLDRLNRFFKWLTIFLWTLDPRQWLACREPSTRWAKGIAMRCRDFKRIQETQRHPKRPEEFSQETQNTIEDQKHHNPRSQHEVLPLLLEHAQHVQLWAFSQSVSRQQSNELGVPKTQARRLSEQDLRRSKQEQYLH